MHSRIHTQKPKIANIFFVFFFHLALLQDYVVQNEKWLKLQLLYREQMDSMEMLYDVGGQQTKTHLTKHLQNGMTIRKRCDEKENSFRLNNFWWRVEKRKKLLIVICDSHTQKIHGYTRKRIYFSWVCKNSCIFFFVFCMEQSIILKRKKNVLYRRRLRCLISFLSAEN